MIKSQVCFLRHSVHTYTYMYIRKKTLLYANYEQRRRSIKNIRVRKHELGRERMRKGVAPPAAGVRS